MDQVDWCGADAVMMLGTVEAKDSYGLIINAGEKLKNWYFENAGVIIETSKSESVVDESFPFVSRSRLPFAFYFESNSVSSSFGNKFELSFDYPSVPEVLCVTSNDFDDFVEEEIPPELKNLIDFEEERRAKPNMDETQTINIGTEKDPKLEIGRAHV